MSHAESNVAERDDVLNGKTVIITGAGRGLGRAYAQSAARSGADVIVADLDGAAAHASVDLIRRDGGRAVASIGPVDDADYGIELVDFAVGTFGRLDGIVANAGIIRPADVLEEESENLLAHLTVNVLGVSRTVVPALRAMKENGSGTAVLVTSGARFGMRAVGAYSASKGAVASLMWTWAIDLEGTGVRVNAISPIADTPMFDATDRYFSSAGASATSPLVDRPAQAEAIAPVVTYLLSDLSAGVNGQVMWFNGTTLGVFPPPAARLANVTRESWQTDDIAEAVDSTLLPALRSATS